MKKIRNLAFGIMFVINAGLLIALLYLFIGRGYYVVSGFTSFELVTIVLAALAVMLTALGIFIAVMAIWGYQSLHTLAKDTSERIAYAKSEEVAARRAEEVAARVAADTSSRLNTPNTGSEDYGAAAGKEGDYEAR